MGIYMNRHHSLFPSNPFNGLPELLMVMENGTEQQSAEAAEECFDQLMLEPLTNDSAQIIIPLLLDLLLIQDKSVAKATILNRMTEFLIQEWEEADVFGIAASYKPAFKSPVGRSGIWRRMMTNRLSELLDLMAAEETTAIQAIYAVHLLQCDDERIEARLLDVTLNTTSPHVRLNGLMALADWRCRVKKGFNPSIAFGQITSQPLYEAMRAVSMGIVSKGGGMREIDMDALMRGIVMPRADRELFPWADGSPAACCAQAARAAMHELGWSDDRMIEWWRKALSQAIESHQHGCRMITWEVGHYEVQWDEECLQWHWNAPMLVADNMLRWRFGNTEPVSPFVEQPESLRKALQLIVEHAIEVPNASLYGVKHLLYPANYIE